MASYIKNVPKPKLPRKRKKAAIKQQGREWYYATIKLFYLTHSKLSEKKCKFWVNSTIKPSWEILPNGFPVCTNKPAQYW